MQRSTHFLSLAGSIVLISCGYGEDNDTGQPTIPTTNDVTTNPTADKDGMGASVGDTGVLAAVEVNVIAEKSVIGFAAGDGWTVDFDKFLIVVGDFDAINESDLAASLLGERTAVIDLRALFYSQFTLIVFDRVAAGRFSSVGFTLPGADGTTTKTPATLEDDLLLMVAGEYSVYIEGVMTKADGQSCAPDAPMDCIPAEQIAFRWGFSAGTAYADCSGFEVPAGTDLVFVELNMTGETWFAPGFSEMGYDATKTRAQWIADADLDRDGETTLTELQSIKASQLFTPALGYDFAGAPIPVETAYDFVEAQARNLGRHSYGYCTTSRAL